MNFLNEITDDWSLFLDRDGVINERNMDGYILDVADFVFLDGVKTAIAEFTQRFQHIFVVTNQQGIGKGLMTECNLMDIHRFMEAAIQVENGQLTKCYFAPNLRAEASQMRKPAIGMALQAQKEFPAVDFSRSIMIGDTDSDIKFGKNAGMKTVRIKTTESIGVEADITVSSLLEFAEMLTLHTK